MEIRLSVTGDDWCRCALPHTRVANKKVHTVAADMGVDYAYFGHFLSTMRESIIFNKNVIMHDNSLNGQYFCVKNMTFLGTANLTNLHFYQFTLS